MLEDAFARQNPALFEYLTLSKYDDGAARETACLTVFAEDGMVKLCLNDRAEGRSAWAAAASFERALAALEAMLEAGEVEWRSRPAGGQARPGKRS